MSFSIFVNYNGNCKEAVTFYADVFGLPVPEMMTFGQAPPDPNFPVEDGDKDRIIYACLMIHEIPVMFSDVPSSMPVPKGSNISITISSKDMDEIRRLYNRMVEGGKVDMELQKTFWSDLYGSVVDKFGVLWQFSHDSGRY